MSAPEPPRIPISVQEFAWRLVEQALAKQAKQKEAKMLTSPPLGTTDPSTAMDYTKSNDKLP